MTTRRAPDFYYNRENPPQSAELKARGYTRKMVASALGCNTQYLHEVLGGKVIDGNLLERVDQFLYDLDRLNLEYLQSQQPQEEPENLEPVEQCQI